MKTRLIAVLALSLLFAGCSNDDTKPDTSSAERTTTTEHLEGPQAYVDSGNYTNGLHLAKITKFDRATRTITYDVVQFLTGDAAKAAYEEDLGEAPDTDYYVRNENTQIRTAELTATAVFRVNNLGGYAPSDPDKGQEVDFNTFAAYFDAEQAFATHFWISLEEGKAVTVEEQYLP